MGRAGTYRVTLASAGGRPVRGRSGVELGTEPLPDPAARIDTLIIPGGDGTHAARHDEELLSYLRGAAARSRRVATVCSGAFLGAAAGLLEGCRVTTHWASVDRLRDEFPALSVDPDPIYFRDGKFWSSAGVTAGIDLSLALVQEDLGVEVAQTVARWLVMFLHRPGGQSQFASPVWVPRRGAVHRAGGADPGRGRTRWQSPHPGPGRRGRHERAPLHPGLHGRGGRVTEPLRRAGTRRSGTRGARDHQRHARSHRGKLRSRFVRDLAAGLPAPAPCFPDAYRRRFRTVTRERKSA